MNPLNPMLPRLQKAINALQIFKSLQTKDHSFWALERQHPKRISKVVWIIEEKGNRSRIRNNETKVRAKKEIEHVPKEDEEGKNQFKMINCEEIREIPGFTEQIAEIVGWVS